MLTFKSIGRSGSLGNQMFQFSVGFSAARRINTDFVIPFTKEYFDAGCNRTINQISDIFPNVKKFCKDKIESSFVVKEREPFYCFINEVDSNAMYPKDFSDFNGYFQNYKYFEDYKKYLIEIFSFKKDTIDKVNRWLSQINAKNFYVGHIRHGDYLKYPDCHPVLSLGYYKECENLSDDCDIKIYVSDDKKFCKYNNLFTTPDNFSVEDDLYLMTVSKNLSIANSSLSWWGAYLNTTDDNKIFYPNKWFGINYRNKSVNIPEKWTLIKDR
jgi:hypothetical protein